MTGGWIQLTTSHNFFSKPLAISAVLIAGLCFCVPGMLAEEVSESAVDHNYTFGLDISFPENGRIVWIDVVPPNATIRGRVYSPGDVSSVIASSKETNQTVACSIGPSFYCDVPVKPGNNTVMITASDGKGATVSETRNFTVKTGLPPPPDISIHGFVMTPDGKPVGGASVLARSAFSDTEKERVVSAVTSGDGAYLVENAFGYRHRITVEKQGYALYSENILFSNITNNLSITLEPVPATSPGFDLPICLAGILGFAGVLFIFRRTRE